MTLTLARTGERHAERPGALLLLHGSASDARQWRSLQGWLGARHEIIAPDLPGYGRSAGVAVRGVADIADWLLAEVGERGPVHVVGHSYGGAVALRLAQRHPQTVRSLTLIEPAAFAALWAARGETIPETRALRRAFRAATVALAAGDRPGAMRHFIDFWNGTGAWDRTSAGLRERLSAQAERLCADYELLAGDPMSPAELSGLACPAFSIRGTRSPAVTRAIDAHLGRHMPFVRHLAVAGAGHMLPLTDPHVTDPAIGEFVARVDHGWQDFTGVAARAA